MNCAEHLHRSVQFCEESLADFFESTLAGIRIAAKVGKTRPTLKRISEVASVVFAGAEYRSGEVGTRVKSGIRGDGKELFTDYASDALTPNCWVSMGQLVLDCANRP